MGVRLYQVQYADDCQIYISTPVDDVAAAVDRFFPAVSMMSRPGSAQLESTATEPSQDASAVAGL